MRRPLARLPPDEEFSISSLVPPDSEFMIEAWISCLQWSLTEPSIFAAFKQDTGLDYHRPRTPMEAMVDQAVGAEKQFLTAYIKWFNVNVWGPIDGV